YFAIALRITPIVSASTSAPSCPTTTAAWLQWAKGASAPLNRRLCARVMRAANRRWRCVRMKSPGTKSAASAPRPYRSADAIRSSGYGVKSGAREDLLGKPRDHAALKRIGPVDDEVLDPNVGVALDDAGDAVGVTVGRVARAIVRLVLDGAECHCRSHTVELTALSSTPLSR